jgi:hypothetical protein
MVGGVPGILPPEYPKPWHPTQPVAGYSPFSAVAPGRGAGQHQDVLREENAIRLRSGTDADGVKLREDPKVRDCVSVTASYGVQGIDVERLPAFAECRRRDPNSGSSACHPKAFATRDLRLELQIPRSARNDDKKVPTRLRFDRTRRERPEG